MKGIIHGQHGWRPALLAFRGAIGAQPHVSATAGVSADRKLAELHAAIETDFDLVQPLTRAAQCDRVYVKLGIMLLEQPQDIHTIERRR
ncbi:hypothetical protein [Hydrocarboniphaga sp.]|uniref:hypothetical protein n=1 Tax=Hydrocarboniphaga sp. TaxID=2033016 RepID=UPI003D0B4959